MQHTIPKLTQITEALQLRDNQRGYGNNNFFLSQFTIWDESRKTLPHYQDDPSMGDNLAQQGNEALIEILTDAWNCNLITTAEYDFLFNSLSLSWEPADN